MSVGAATLTAVIVTGLMVGMLVGGVYNPVAEIVPTVAEPPVTPFTCHVTAVFASLVTVAVNCVVDPSLTCEVPVTVTCGVVLMTLAVPGLEPPHPPIPSKTLRQAAPGSQLSKRLQEDRRLIRRVMQPLHQEISLMTVP